MGFLQDVDRAAVRADVVEQRQTIEMDQSKVCGDGGGGACRVSA
jgi:hypothetical protein